MLHHLGDSVVDEGISAKVFIHARSVRKDAVLGKPRLEYEAETVHVDTVVKNRPENLLTETVIVLA